MNKVDDSTTMKMSDSKLRELIPRPGLLIAHSVFPVEIDRVQIENSIIVGRRQDGELPIVDYNISKVHFRIFESNNRFWIQDLESTNGTFVNGDRISSETELQSPTLIRAGQTLFVFHEQSGYFVSPPPDNHGFVGPFHANAIVEEIETAVRSNRHILLAGPVGSGKKLAAKAIHRLAECPDKLFCAVDADSIPTHEEAMAAIFGAAHGVDSDKEPQVGLLEEFDGGVLFFDHAHHLPEVAQRLVLRVMEDGTYFRVGETEQRRTNIRIVFSTDAPLGGDELDPDLVERLGIVTLSSLKDRMADIPEIFKQLMTAELQKRGEDVKAVLSGTSVKNYESMCLNGFMATNVSGLRDLVIWIVASVVLDLEVPVAISTAFAECGIFGG